MASTSKKGLGINGVTCMVDGDKCVEKLDYVQSEFSDTDESSGTDFGWWCICD